MATGVKTRRPPQRQPPPVSPEDFLHDLHRRAVRIETRLGRMMEHLGLDSNGDPLPVEAIPAEPAYLKNVKAR